MTAPQIVRGPDRRAPEPPPERAILADLTTADARTAALVLALATIPYLVTAEGKRYVFTVPAAQHTRATFALLGGLR